MKTKQVNIEFINDRKTITLNGFHIVTHITEKVTLPPFSIINISVYRDGNPNPRWKIS